MPKVPTIELSEFAPRFIIQISFAFFNIESIRIFTWTFVAICSAKSHPFEFSSRTNHTHHDTIKLLVATLENQYKNVAFIQFDKNEELERSYKWFRTPHKIKIIVQTTDGDEYLYIGNSEIRNKILANIKKVLLLNSSYKK